MSKITVRFWVWLGIFNLLVVASIGALMRLKFVYAMPSVNLKYLQHAHSHFAFGGWVTHMLMVCLFAVCFRLGPDGVLPKRQQFILAANALVSFAMLISFACQGYGAWSIIFSTSSIFVSYVFAWHLWKDLKKNPLDKNISRWFFAALSFLVLSSLGTFYLAYLMASHQINVKDQLASVYFYLHFQYNGWFLFAIMGLVCHMLQKFGIRYVRNRLLYHILVVTVTPLYLLSVLWWEMGQFVYSVLVLAVVCQLCVWIWWMAGIVKRRLIFSAMDISPYLRTVFWLVVWAVLVKFTLQALSVIPSLSEYVYGFRPVIIGYLHLVLLLIVSVFLLSYVYQASYLAINAQSKVFNLIFLCGAVLNEVFLALQASMALFGTGFGHAHYFLLYAALTMVLGLIGMLGVEMGAYFSGSRRPLPPLGEGILRR